jgi:hypothetical protein
VYSLLDTLTSRGAIVIFVIVYAPLTALLGAQYLRSLDGPLSPARDRVVIGDFLAFQTGAQIIADGHGARLYDLREQRAIQDRLAGKAFAEWQPYVNPPLLAIALRPLARLGTLRAFYVYCGIMIVSGTLGAIALVRVVPALAATPADRALVGLIALSFHPIARTMFAGQNTVLTWALLCGVVWSLQRRRQWVAGTFLGVLTYKPQYLPFPLLLLMVLGAWHALAAVACAGLAHYALGALFVGAQWPLRMMTAMREYRPLEWAESVGTHFSLVAFFDHAVGGRPGRIVAGAAISGVIAALWRFAPRVQPGSARFPLLCSLVVVAGMLVSPHLQYYDFGVLVLPVAVGLDRTIAKDRVASLRLRIAFVLLYLAYPWLYEAGDQLGFQPLTLCTLGIYAWLCRIAVLDADSDGRRFKR